MERRTLIRLLVGLGIGIPVLVEALTFLGLLETRLFGDGDGGPATPAPERVGVGDELRPDTPQTETVSSATIQGQDTPWVFVFTVAVENPTETAYELRLRTLTLGSGRTVETSTSTGRIPGGGSGQVTGAWEIPQGSTPAELETVAVTYEDGSTAESVATVTLAKVAVQGG